MGLNEETRLIVARDKDDGEPIFQEAYRQFVIDTPGVVHGGHFWETPSGLSVPGSIGGVPTNANFPAVGAVRLGLFEWAPHSDGRFNAAALLDDVETGADGDPAMHASNTVDFDYIVSGRVDIELAGGASKTLNAGDILVMGGSVHAWKNRYDEPCRFLAVMIGAARERARKEEWMEVVL